MRGWLANHPLPVLTVIRGFSSPTFSVLSKTPNRCFLSCSNLFLLIFAGISVSSDPVEID